MIFVKKNVDDLNRHLKTVHNASADAARRIMAAKRLPSKNNSELKHCQEAGCGAAVVRLDIHMRKVHKVFSIPFKFGKFLVARSLIY